MPETNLLSATTIVDTKVVDPTGEDLGSIEDLVVDLDNGVISYAILSYGGFMGMGNKWFAIPWAAFTQSNSEKKFVLSIAKEVLKEADGFDKDNWPMMDRDWGETVYEFYGYEPYWNKERVAK